MPLNVLIADDEAPARRKLVRFLEAHDDIAIVAEASNGIDAVDLIALTKPQLVFLDINMPDLDGLGVAETLVRSEEPPSIVFVTAFNQYAVKAFEINALDYLLKPYDQDRFEQALSRARKSLDVKPDAEKLAQTLASARKEDQYVRRMLVPNDGRSFFVATREMHRLDSTITHALNVGARIRSARRSNPSKRASTRRNSPACIDRTW